MADRLNLRGLTAVAASTSMFGNYYENEKREEISAKSDPRWSISIE
jgi:hypothetical protein